jgi:hypothetical protein
MDDPGASLLRENTGTTGLELTARAAVEALAARDIPHLLVGGLTVQEHGYHRVTLDVGLVVPAVLEALEFLAANVTEPFVRVPGCDDRVRDQRNGVFVDLLPGGKVLRRGCQVPFPEPTEVTEKPAFVSLEQLISLKLDSWSHNPTNRHKDKTDVIELIKARRLPRGLDVAAPVRQHYVETWDALQAET